MPNDLKQIKKLYGEAMMHFCRKAFSTILETEGLLPKLLQENFAKSHRLYNDLTQNNLLEKFKEYMFGLLEIEKKKKNPTTKSPQELMALAGYRLYECKSEKDIQKFKKYYAKGEELCTFNGNRLNSCYVFFAVKENVDEIKREDFTMPNRQDEYGTSVISIQFSRSNAHTLSIKNRYNHTVSNPDATFSNDLEQIIPGLTDSFSEHYGLEQKYLSRGLEIPNYVRADDGKFYKFNYEENGIYYCPDNIIIDEGKPTRYPKEKYIIMDYFILNLQKKYIELFDNIMWESFSDLIRYIRKIEVLKEGNERTIIISYSYSKTDNDEKSVTILLDELNRIKGLKSDSITEIYDDFLVYNKILSIFEFPNLREIGECFLLHNEDLEHLELPSLLNVGDSFLYNNNKLVDLKVPKLQEVGYGFLFYNCVLRRLELPSYEGDSRCLLRQNSNTEIITGGIRR